MSRRRWALASLALLAAGAGVSTLACLGWLRSDTGNEALRTWLEAELSDRIPGAVVLGGLQADRGSIRIEGLVLRHPDGAALLRAQVVHLRPEGVWVEGLEGKLDLARDGSIRLRDALGPWPDGLPIWSTPVVVHGRVDVDVGGFQSALEDLQVVAHAEVGGPGPNLRYVSLTGTLVNDLGSTPVVVQGHVSAEQGVQAELNGHVAHVDAQLVGAIQDPFVTGQTTAELRVVGSAPAPLQTGVDARVSVRGDYGGLVVDAVQQGALAATGAASLNLRQPSWPWTGSGTVEATEAVWPVLPASSWLNGAVEAGGTLVPGASAQGTFRGRARVAGLSLADTELQADLGTPGITLHRVVVRGPHAVQGHGRLDWGGAIDLDARLDLALDHLTELGVPAMPGRVHGQVGLHGSAVRGLLAVDGLRYARVEIPHAEGTLRGTYTDDHRLRADVRWQAPQVVGPALVIQDASAAGAVRWQPGRALRFTGTTTLDSARFAGELQSTGLSGPLTATAQRHRPLQLQASLDGVASVQRWATDALHLEGQLSGDHFVGEARGSSPWGRAAAQVRADVASGRVEILEAGVEPLRGPRWAQVGSADLQLTATGFEDGRLELEDGAGGHVRLAGSVAPEPEVLATFSGNLDTYLPSWSGAVQGDGGWGEAGLWGRGSVDHLRFEGVELGAMTAEGRLQDLTETAPLTAEVTVEGPVLAALAVRGTLEEPVLQGSGTVPAAQLAFSVDGGTTLAVEVTGLDTRLEGTIETDWSGLRSGESWAHRGRFTGTSLLPSAEPTQATASLSWAVGRVQGEGQLGTGQWTLRGRYPDGALPGPAWRQAELRLDAHDLPLELIATLHPDLAADAGTLDARGGWLDGAPWGEFEVDDALIRHRFFGLRSLDTQVRGSLYGTEVALEATGQTRSSADLSRRRGSYTVNLTGVRRGLTLADLAGTVVLKSAVVMDRPNQLVHLSTTAPLQLSGDLQNPRIVGGVRVDLANLQVDRSLLLETGVQRASPRALDPRIRIVEDGVPRVQEQLADLPIWSALRASIDVDLGPSAFGSMHLPVVDGLGGWMAQASSARLYGRGRGLLHLEIEAGSIAADGEIDIAEGTAELGNSSFEIDQAGIVFPTGSLFEPYVFARGTRLLQGGGEVGMTLRGSPAAARLSLYSPTLASRDDVLLAVLTGAQPTSTGSNFDLAVSLALDIAQSTVLQRVAIGNWQLRDGLMQARYRLDRRWFMVYRVGMTPESGLMSAGFIFAPGSDLQVQLTLGFSDAWVGIDWRRSF